MKDRKSALKPLPSRDHEGLQTITEVFQSFLPAEIAQLIMTFTGSCRILVTIEISSHIGILLEGFPVDNQIALEAIRASYLKHRSTARVRASGSHQTAPNEEQGIGTEQSIPRKILPFEGIWKEASGIWAVCIQVDIEVMEMKELGTGDGDAVQHSVVESCSNGNSTIDMEFWLRSLEAHHTPPAEIRRTVTIPAAPKRSTYRLWMRGFEVWDLEFWKGVLRKEPIAVIVTRMASSEEGKLPDVTLWGFKAGIYIL